MARPSALLLALGLVLLAQPVLGATTAAEAATYLYPLKVDDAAGDQTGPFDLPGNVVPENDILSLEVTDDATALVVRVTMGTMEFAGPSGTVTVTVQLTGPDDEAWEATVVYTNGGADPTVSDYDSDQTTGDGDDLLPGARVEVVAPAVYIFADHSATGLTVGDSIELAGVSSGRGVSVPSAAPPPAGGAGGSFSNFDVVDVDGRSYTLASNAAPAPAAPSTETASQTTTAASPYPTSAAPTTTTSPTAQAPGANPDAAEDDTATGGFPTQEAGKDAPAIQPFVLLAALAALAVALRRRLA